MLVLILVIDYFCVYLINNKFIVNIDYKVFIWLKMIKYINVRLI